MIYIYKYHILQHKKVAYSSLKNSQLMWQNNAVNMMSFFDNTTLYLTI